MHKISVVIRNKDEAFYLDTTLKILTEVYCKDLREIIVIDNDSIDNSVKVAESYGCIVHKIKDFTYGRAINVGIEKAASNYVLLLSSHAVPVGQSFFQNTIDYIKINPQIAGIRYINGIENYKRALGNNFMVKEPLRFGLMAGCCLINKDVWKEIKFNEQLTFSEDKEWSSRVMNAGYGIADLNETFFYFINRSKKTLITRFKNETFEEYNLQKKRFPSKIHLMGSFVKAGLFKNAGSFFEKISYEYQLLKAKLYIQKELKEQNKS